MAAALEHAAAAQGLNATWVCFDRGFARFEGLRWVNPAQRPNAPQK